MLRKKSVRNSSNQRIQNQKVLITVGLNETGKSSLLTQLTKQKFSPQYKSTIGVDYYSKEFKDKNNKKLILSIWDTNGAEKETPILPSKIYYSADAFLILCSYDNKKSFESLVDWINFLRNQREKHQSTEFNNKLITTFVIINKSDLQQKLFSQQDVKDLIHKIFQAFATTWMSELSERFCFDLTDTFTGYVKFLANFFQCSGVSIFQTKA